ncbi:helix-turn-helix domain-containing protein [Arthrobacter woluwensis]|uniref:helix-turn-helix domain-containing protein n=1 Tax=Arthrobacter woluwensis TaxID=156980 RepID=UPI00382DCE7E
MKIRSGLEEAILQNLVLDALQTFSAIAHAANGARRGSSPLDVANDAIATLFGDPSLTPSRVAEIAGISLRQLQRILPNVGSVIRDRRLDAASEQFSSGNVNISDVSKICGFSTPSQFRRAFIARHQLPPSQYLARQSAPESLGA